MGYSKRGASIHSKMMSLVLIYFTKVETIAGGGGDKIIKYFIYKIKYPLTRIRKHKFFFK